MEKHFSHDSQSIYYNSSILLDTLQLSNKSLFIFADTVKYMGRKQFFLTKSNLTKQEQHRYRVKTRYSIAISHGLIKTLKRFPVHSLDTPGHSITLVINAKCAL